MNNEPLRRAEALLLLHWDGALPVDPQRIAQDVGIAVQSKPELNTMHDGQITVAIGYECDTAIIVYNPHHHLNRIRLGIAHAVGHYVLGHLQSEKPNNLYLDNAESLHSPKPGSKDHMATTFALALLMPRDVVHHLFRYEIETIEAFAERFQLSTRAVSLRLQQLGYLPPLEV